MNAIIKLCLMVALALNVSSAKRTTCRNKLNKDDDDFHYCTKFAVAKGHAFKASIKFKLTRDMTD